MTMEDWSIQLDGILTLSRYNILTHCGKISADIAKKHAETEFEKYRIIQDDIYTSDFDRYVNNENMNLIDDNNFE